jgi:hypothetical protein
MKDADMIRVIAEFDGWKFVPSHDNARGNAMPECWCQDDTESTCWEFSHLPPYLTSLDAIVPVTEKLEFIHRLQFTRELTSILDSEPPRISTSFDRINSTARQRCEALVRTLGKWEEA